MTMLTKKVPDYWKKFWMLRSGDWNKAYFKTIHHPHRDKLFGILKKLKFGSLLEIGCNSAPNLYRAKKEFPNVKLAGIDICEDAIKEAIKFLPEADLRVGMAERLPFDDESYDIVLSDAVMMYFDYYEIEQCLKEIKRVGKKYLLLCEPQIPENEMMGNYYGRDYEELLKDFGFEVLKVKNVLKKDWDSDELWSKYGKYILAEKKVCPQSRICPLKKEKCDKCNPTCYL